MLGKIKKMLGLEEPTDYKTLVKQGAIILDVRSRGEYKGGHINGSINISVDELPHNLHRLPDKTKTIITCCASGMRSASARRILQATGYIQVYNGGSWATLVNKI
jgi:rhodanese-related sulfurtransferase